MKGACVIAEKDLRTIFMSPLFYIICGICTLIWFPFFGASVDQFLQYSRFGQGRAEPLHMHVIYGHFSIMNFIMIFAVAAITMRLFTEEKRNRTFDLLLTAPVTSSEIVVGKLVAGVLTTWALLAVGLLYPLSLAFYAPMDWGPFASSVIGVFLLCACYVAIGMFASSLTQSAVVAVILGLIFNLSLWFIGVVANSASDPTQKTFIEHLSVTQHFQTFILGSPSVSGLVYFFSVIFLFSFLTRQVVESARWR